MLIKFFIMYMHEQNWRTASTDGGWARECDMPISVLGHHTQAKLTEVSVDSTYMYLFYWS